MATKLATNFGANVAGAIVAIGGYFNARSGPTAPSVKVMTAFAGLERDGGDTSVEWVTLGTPNNLITRDFNTLDAFTITEGHFQIRLHLATLAMGVVAGTTYELISLKDTSGVAQVTLKLLSSNASQAKLRVDAGGGWTGTTAALNLSTTQTRIITLFYDNSNPLGVAEFRVWHDGETNDLNLTNTGALSAIGQITLGGPVVVAGDDGGSTFRCQHLWIDDNTATADTGTVSAFVDTTHITLQLGDTYATNALANYWIYITGGTGIGNSRKITSNTNANPSVVAFTGALTTDITSTYSIVPSGALRPNHQLRSYGWHDRPGTPSIILGDTNDTYSSYSNRCNRTDSPTGPTNLSIPSGYDDFTLVEAGGGATPEKWGGMADCHAVAKQYALSPTDTGTAKAATVTTITLQNGDNYALNVLANLTITITGGTGITQQRVITSNSAGSGGTNPSVLVVPIWTTTPDTTSTYSLTVPGSSQQLWKARQDLIVTKISDGGDNPTIQAVSMSVSAYATGASTPASNMQAIIHDGTTALLVGPVRWVGPSTGDPQLQSGIWLLPTAPDGSAWTWDKIRSLWYGVQYDTAATGNPAAALDDLRVVNISLEVWYNDSVISLPNPPQSRRPLPCPVMC